MIQQNMFSLGQQPILLAPLAGVSDYPFRLVCEEQGADLTFVEMLSATALVHNSKRTLQMLSRHPEEKKVGIQITGPSAEEIQRAIEVLNPYPFESIDINMGCPVKKVVKVGCGAAILKDPERVYQTVLKAKQTCDKPLSVKIRLGWDHSSLTYREVSDACESAGALWLTVHGRTRNDSYASPVLLSRIAEIKAKIKIPVFGNGNLFNADDAELMRKETGVDGLMVSRGALGNPWVFAEMKGTMKELELDVWYQGVVRHCKLQAQAYGDSLVGVVCMRKHLLWYLKGWPEMRAMRASMGQISTWDEVYRLLDQCHLQLKQLGAKTRFPKAGGFARQAAETEGEWDPKYEMDREVDRGVDDL